VKYCLDLAKLVPDLAACCTSCHEDGDDEFEVVSQGVEYHTCCYVSRFMEERAKMTQVSEPGEST
jgi:hypothetical protein